MIEFNPNSKIEIKWIICIQEFGGTPPPDICEFMLANNEIFDSIRKNKCKLTRTQTEKA